MAKLLVWSDLHNEFWDDIPDIPDDALDADALLLAGDISTKGRHVDIALLLWDKIRKPVIMVRGNHEFYGSTMSEIVDDEKERIAKMNAAGADIRMLDGDSTIVNGTRIIGGTLWTDFGLYPGYDAKAQKAVRLGMSDFSQIRTSPGKSFDVAEWLRLHWNDREAIIEALSMPHDGPTFVMTHHMPVRAMIHPLREIGSVERNLMNAGFASDMAWQIKDLDIDGWICGHSHDNRSAELSGKFGTMKFISNARGYPKEGCAFDPGMIIDTEAFFDRKMARQPDVSP